MLNLAATNSKKLVCIMHENFFPEIGFRLELVDEFTKVIPSSFGPFIGHHQGLLACVKSIFFKEFLKVF